MRLDAAVDHHVARDELFDGERLHPGRRRQPHRGVVRNQRRRGVSGIHRIAQTSTHRRVVVAVVADRSVAEVAAVAPAGVPAAQVLAPYFLQQVPADRRGVAQLGR